MSGGDLDGDVYMCIWDASLVEAVKDSAVEEPAPTDPNVDVRGAHSGDLLEHVGYYMKNDTLGELSNLHVAMCDQKPLGPKDADCIKVAAMISVQVDFAKHSECISKQAFEHIKESIKAFPDYL